MTRLLYAIPATLCLAAAVVTAQAPAGDKPASNPPATQQPAGQPPAGQQPSTGKPTTSSPSSQQPSSAMAGNKITYVGCVKPGTSTGTWVLENAEAQKSGAASPGAASTSGGSTMTLNLDPAATVNLKAHANHKVEIVGMMSTGSGATPAAGAHGGEAAAGVTGATEATGKAGAPGAAGGTEHRRNRSRRRASFRASLQCGIVENGFCYLPVRVNQRPGRVRALPGQFWWRHLRPTHDPRSAHASSKFVT